jgi:hypothetical protein
MAEISMLLKKETIFGYGECRQNFNDTVHFKFKVQRVVNLFEDTGSVVPC